MSEQDFGPSPEKREMIMNIRESERNLHSQRNDMEKLVSAITDKRIDTTDLSPELHRRLINLVIDLYSPTHSQEGSDKARKELESLGVSTVEIDELSPNKRPLLHDIFENFVAQLKRKEREDA